MNLFRLFFVYVLVACILLVQSAFVFETIIYFDGQTPATLRICEGQRPEDAVDDFMDDYEFGDARLNVYNYILEWVCGELTNSALTTQCTSKVPLDVTSTVNFAELGYPLVRVNIRTRVEVDVHMECACSYISCDQVLKAKVLDILNTALSSSSPEEGTMQPGEEQDLDGMRGEDVDEERFAADDPYKVMGFVGEVEVTEAIIKRRYRDLAKKYHPDKNLHRMEWATEAFKNITRAYEILVDSDKRRQYDSPMRGYPSGTTTSSQSFQFHSSGGGFTFTFNFGF